LVNMFKNKIRGGPLDIWGGGLGNFSVHEFFLNPNCLQEFFFLQRSFARYFF
jgi:hypothetical protein